MATKISLGRR